MNFLIHFCYSLKGKQGMEHILLVLGVSFCDKTRRNHDEIVRIWETQWYFLVNYSIAVKILGQVEVQNGSLNCLFCNLEDFTRIHVIKSFNWHLLLLEYCEHNLCLMRNISENSASRSFRFLDGSNSLLKNQIQAHVILCRTLDEGRCSDFGFQ